MDYEKKYKEALERMKSWAKGEHPECFSEAQKTAEFIFPELKESEGDRMRKNLYKCLRYYVPNDIAEEYIKWLEKQGEKKPTDEVEPKFKVGDKVTVKGDNTIYTIGIIAPDKTCWLKHGSREYGWATFGVLKHYVE